MTPPMRWALDVMSHAALQADKEGRPSYWLGVHAESPADWTQPRAIPDDEPTPPEVREAWTPRRVAINADIRGFIGTSGLRAACPECGRLMEHSECKLHGKMKPRWVLKAKVLLDATPPEGWRRRSGSLDADALLAAGAPPLPWAVWGTSEDFRIGGAVQPHVVAFLRDSAILALTGLTLEKVEAISREAMSLEAGAEAVEKALLNARVEAVFDTITSNDPLLRAWATPTDEGWIIVVG